MACAVPVAVALGSAAGPPNTCGHDQPASHLDFLFAGGARDAAGFELNEGPIGHPPSEACEVAHGRQGCGKRQ